MSAINLPATTVKCKYLKSLPIKTVYQDPLNKFFYQVVERECNSSLVKSAVPSFDGSKAIQIDVPSKYLKLQNTSRPNINALLKQRLTQLEQENKLLKTKRFKSTISVIKELLDGKCYFEGDDHYYCFKDNLIMPVKKSKYPIVEDALKKHETTMEQVWKDSQTLQKVMSKQEKLQETLLELLLLETTTIDTDEKIIEL